MLKALIRFLFRILYRFRAYNEAVLKTPGPVLLLPNHLSWWDWLIVGVCLENDWRFVTSKTTAQLTFIHRWIMTNRRTFPVDVNSPYAVKHMAEYLQSGGRLVLFPEGRMSYTGSLMKLFDGTGFLISKTHAKVITAYLRGAGRLPFSRNPNQHCWFPEISVHFSEILVPPHIIHTSSAIDRNRLTAWLRDRMTGQQFATEMEFGARTVPEAILESARQHAAKPVLQDTGMKALNYRRLLTGANLLGSVWRQRLGETQERVGILLPNANALPVSVLSLWLSNKVPAILNYTTGIPIMLACGRVASLKHIVTSRLFLQRAKIDGAALEQAGMKLWFLEDVRKEIGVVAKLMEIAGQWIRPRLRMHGPARKHEDPAVVLFTSGSEGDPKAVELTHRNLLANIRQMVSVIDLMETDRFFNALPLFHSFGLTVGLLLPLVRGVFVFLYISPLHYRVVPSAFYDLHCTVFFGTNTFLTGYARKAHPYDFRTVRYLFAGAEKLQEITVRTWCDKFGVRVLEGYGATECSPCVSANTPMRPRKGSAGQFLPGIEYKLEPVEGVPQGGRLFVRGPNIMRGYLNPEANAKFLALNGWYDTGDIVDVDADGYLFVLGRLKRFAKISGEMVSLTAVEEALAAGIQEFGLKFVVAVVARPDESKGEKLIAVTNEPRLTLDKVREAVRARGLGNLAAPRELKVVHEIPRLGTGKINHRELEKQV